MDTIARRFVRLNLDNILSKKMKIPMIKIAKKQFFEKNKIQGDKRFTNSIIAFETLLFLIDIHKVKNEEQINNICNAPFIRKFLKEKEKELLIDKISGPDELVLPPEILYSKMRQQNFLFEIKEKLSEEARKEIELEISNEKSRISEIRQMLSENLVVIEKFRSDLENLQEAPDIEGLVQDIFEKKREINVVESKLYWWQKFNLKGDPFPNKIGLYGFSESDFDEIIVRTDLVKKYTNMFLNYPNEMFGKTILLSGQFGSGKTTIFQYGRHLLSRSNIYPMIIILNPTQDWERILDQFYSNVFNEISEGLIKSGYSDPRSEEYNYSMPMVQKALTTLIDTYQLNGIALFIDGLHKGEKTVESSLEFVKQLQNYHEYFIMHGINIGIFIASSPYWLRRIKRDPTYSGSYHKIDEIPPIKFSDAFQLLQTRIEHYRNDKENQIFFDKATIQYAYTQVSSNKNENITFRDFIDYLIPRLERGDFENIGISISFDMEIFDTIHGQIMKSVIVDSYLLYLKLTKDKSKVMKASSFILNLLYKKKGIGEKNSYFKNNKGAFWVLWKSGLITKVAGNQTNIFLWTLSNDFVATLEKLAKKGIIPKFIFKTFRYDPEIRNIIITSDKDEICQTIEKIIEDHNSEWPDVTKTLSRVIEKYNDISNDFSIPLNKLSRRCIEIIREIITSIQIATNTTFSEEDWMSQTWIAVPAPECIENVFKGCNRFKEKTSYYQNFLKSIKLLLDLIKEIFIAFKIIDFSSLQIGNAEKQIIYNAAIEFENGKLTSAINTICELIEREIRISMNLLLSIFTDGDIKLRLPQALIKSINTNERKKVSLQKSLKRRNLLYFLNRGEYKEIIQYQSNWNDIFKEIFTNKTRNDVISAFENIFQLDTRQLHRDEPKYFRRVKEKIRKAIIDASWILEGFSLIYEYSLCAKYVIIKKNEENILIKLSLTDEKCKNSKTITLSKNDGKYIANRIENNKYIDIADDGVLWTKYHTNQYMIAVVINYLIYCNGIKLESDSRNNSTYNIIMLESNICCD